MVGWDGAEYGGSSLGQTNHPNGCRGPTCHTAADGRNCLVHTTDTPNHRVRWMWVFFPGGDPGTTHVLQKHGCQYAIEYTRFVK